MNSVRTISPVHAILCVLCWLLWFGGHAMVHAATPAGTVIKNQASASYKDSSGVTRVATSNVVETTIQQVAAMQLNQNQNRPAAAGQQLFFTHSVTNTGNGVDRFTIAALNNAGDDFDLNSIAVYEDNNQDGQPDVFSPVTLSASLAAQESWHFVVAVTAPATAGTGESANLTITATSEFNTGFSETNTDSVSVSDQAVLELTKSITATAGVSPFGPLTVSLNYRNTGAGSATNVTIIDALPAGMDYVPGSGRWNETGATVLTDANSADSQGGSPTVRFCAYDASCAGLAEADADSDGDSTNQVTAVISNVPAGMIGQISFQINIASGLSAGTLFNTAEYEYNAGPRYNSNTVAFQVLHSAGVVLNGSTTLSTDGTGEPSVVATAAQGVAVSFESYVWNTGNDTDTFDITVDNLASSFPAGSVFRILQSDGMTPLIDTSGNGIPDTGPLPADSVYKTVVQVIAPAATVGNNGGAGYEVSAWATSAVDAGVSNPMLNRLLEFSTASVDITNVAQSGDAAALGGGAGPEAAPVSTLVIAPGASAILPLYINNTGAASTAFDLAVSTMEDYSSIELPANWSVTFRIDGETDDVTNTGAIDPGEFVLVNAIILVAAAEVAGDTSLYFRALSEITGASDIKHDAISVTEVEEILLEPGQSGQTDPGGSYTYSHLLSNNGNTTATSIALTLTDTMQSQGWASIVYEDTDGDDVLGGADLQIDSIVSLPPGQLVRLFVKVFAPADGALQTVNTTTLAVAWNSGADVIDVADVTTISESEISIVKEQAPDFGCNGTLEASYGVSGFAVEPGNNCVSYRLTATNAGVVTVYNIEIADATPAFTEYVGSAVCSAAGCSIQEPAVGSQGNVVGTLSSLAAGDSVVLEFSVRVE